MDNFLKLATNRNSLKSLVKGFSIDELKIFSSNLTIIIEQRKNKEEELREKHKQKIRKIEEIKSLLAEQNLSIDDLIGDPLHYILLPKAYFWIKHQYTIDIKQQHPISPMSYCNR